MEKVIDVSEAEHVSSAYSRGIVSGRSFNAHGVYFHEGGGWRIMTVRAMFHICMELWGIFICLICACGIFIATPHKTRRTRIKILMQIACMLLLGTDALS